MIDHVISTLLGKRGAICYVCGYLPSRFQTPSRPAVQSSSHSLHSAHSSCNFIAQSVTKFFVVSVLSFFHLIHKWRHSRRTMCPWLHVLYSILLFSTRTLVFRTRDSSSQHPCPSRRPRLLFLSNICARIPSVPPCVPPPPFGRGSWMDTEC